MANMNSRCKKCKFKLWFCQQRGYCQDKEENHEGKKVPNANGERKVNHA